MRKVFLDDLPRWGKGSHEGKINWEKCAGYKVNFIYDDIEGEIEIVKSYTKEKNNNRYIQCKYKDNNVYSIYSNDFVKGRLGMIIGKKTYNYKHNIGDIINTKSGLIEIIDQIKILHNRKNGNNTTDKGYRYKCLVCGNEGELNEFDELDKKINRGCNVCSGKKILKGYNDIATTHPDLLKYFVNKEDAYTHSYGSDSIIQVKCPDCGYKKKKRLSTLSRYDGFSCPKCGDGISYPEKIIFNILEQLHISFKTQLNNSDFQWCKIYKYDFYFKLNNKQYIIETHGLQHYEESFQRIKSNKKIKTLEEEQENDKLKEKLAKENGIEHYIVIDCRKSELEWIKNNILNSKLAKLFDLSKVDWLQCHKFACSSLVKKICNSWNGVYSNIELICLYFKFSRPTIIKYLKLGTKLGWCNYSIEEAKKQIFLYQMKKIICITTKEKFNSITEASKKYNIDNKGIGGCCKKKYTYSGTHPTTGEKLKWMYYDEYIKQYGEIENIAS